MQSNPDISGKRRVVIEGVRPEIDGGRFPIKRIVGDTVTVEADIFADGHDQIACRLLYRMAGSDTWLESPMTPLGNDRWTGGFAVTELGEYEYTIEGWVDHYLTWHHDLIKRVKAGQDVAVEVLIGARLAEEAASRATGDDANRLYAFAVALRTEQNAEVRNALGVDEDIAALVHRYPDRRHANRYHRDLVVTVARERARFSTWYELFPRSCSPEPGRHGTLRDCEARLPYVASMGFDVLYLPPIHPIGTTFRKGKNNAVTAEPGDVGSPWAIGGPEGGHKSIHPELGTFADFQSLVKGAASLGMEIALDIAFQCAPDHPYVREHPQWFRHRPDGTIQYAENPPKKYQDIYPIDFETDDWQALWKELQSIFLFWIDHGVKIFRVDNPHTKAFPFWEWAIRGIKQKHPDVIFLSEAFTRPRVMYRLAKLGFDQSYTYFTWRTSKYDLTTYFQELTQTEVAEYARPNLWPNTPDILPEHLQSGGRPAFMARLVLAATLGASYGIYGAAYELCDNTPRVRGSEEYLDSEKYEIKKWDIGSPDSLREFIGRVNNIRRNNHALQANHRLTFHQTDNPILICYSKTTPDLANIIVTVVNLDPINRQSGWVSLDLRSLGLEQDQDFQVFDLINDHRYFWRGSANYVELAPWICPAHIFRVRTQAHTEKDFDYYS